MAVDKLVDSAVLDANLTAVANAIRTKGGTSAQLAFPAGFVSAVQAIPTGGGADLGGLANMMDVQTQNSEFAYMLMCMKNGDTKGGTVTYTSAFANTPTKILETGITTIHGLLFVSALSINGGTGAGLCSSVFIFQRESESISVTGWNGTNVSRVYGQTQGTVQESSPLQGAITFTGGDVYYTGRYNKNASYQLLSVNTEYNWLAW